VSSEFYDVLGIDPAAGLARIRRAYGQAVSRLAKRRRALVEQGGDAAQLDLQRAHLDEAWEIVSDPLRRRRYDAMLRWADAEERPRDADGVWSQVSDALVHPAAAVAAKLLRVTSRLPEIGVLPLAPSGATVDPPTLVPHDDDLTTPRPAARLGAGPVSASTPERADITDRLTHPGAPERGLKVVDGSPGSSDVLVLPPRPEPTRSVVGLSAEAVEALIDEHGVSGALLQAVRERLGLSLRDVADHTRISERYLAALEAEDRDALPSATFVRGYAREVARMLQLDVEGVVSAYMARFAQ